ncbi:MAG: FAD-dependent oxidoreductase [Thermotaleaceae bacterium]
MKYVIIGASAAGIHGAKTLRSLDSHGEITILSEDEKVISRCMLHHGISGKRSEKELSFVKEDYFERYNIQWRKGVTVKAAAFSNQQVLLGDGEIIPYDRLLIASGAQAVLPPIKGMKEGKNVFTLRNLGDVRGILSCIGHSKSAVIIGAGLIGMDAAMALLERNVSVNIVEMAEHILPLQLDDRAAGQYENLLEEKGAKIFTRTSVTEIENQKGVNLVKLQNGIDIACEMIIVAAGVKPRIDFLNEQEIETEKGIKVNNQMETSVSNVYAAGDVTGLSAIWPSAVKQGIVAASNMAGVIRYYDDYFAEKNSIHLFGLKTISVGKIDPPDDSYQVDLFVKQKIYKKVIHKDGIIYGIILQGDISRSGFWSYLIKEKIKIDFPYRDIFSIQYGDFYPMEVLEEKAGMV